MSRNRIEDPLHPDYILPAPSHIGRIGMTVSDPSNPITPIEQAPSAGAQIWATLKIVALVVASIAGSVVALQASGVALPGWLLTLATTILAIATPLGIASPGVAKKDAPKQ